MVIRKMVLSFSGGLQARSNQIQSSKGRLKNSGRERLRTDKHRAPALASSPMENGVADQNSRPSGNPKDGIALIKNDYIHFSFFY